MPEFSEPILNGLLVMPEMNPYYEYYRFMTMTAGEPDHKAPAKGQLRDVPAALAYTPQEMQMLQKALKRMGKKGKLVTGCGSREPNDTYVNSPVPHNSGKKKKS